jgi:metallo-beta-lactamase family protein
MPQIKHHGAVNGVTGSCHELLVDDQNSVLIDCGLFQGAEASNAGASFEKLQIEFSIDHVRALLVTHCHIDHVGRIPYLFAAGFDGPIYCSMATLLPLVLENAIKVGFTRDQSLVQRAVKKICRNIIGVDYKKWIDLAAVTGLEASHIRAKFSPAGHILGSAYIEFDIRGSAARKKSKRILFSGDLGAPYTPLLPAPKSPYSADIVVIESTYGDRLHEGRRTRRNQLKKIVEKCLQDSCVILIPAFSIGRTQELLYELEGVFYCYEANKAANEAEWNDLEIIIDSPLAARFTDTYRELKSFWDKEARRKVRAGRHPLSFVDSHDEHIQTVEYLTKYQCPAICSGQLIPDSKLSFSSSATGDKPWLYWCGRSQL